MIIGTSKNPPKDGDPPVNLVTLCFEELCRCACKNDVLMQRLQNYLQSADEDALAEARGKPA